MKAAFPQRVYKNYHLVVGHREGSLQRAVHAGLDNKLRLLVSGCAYWLFVVLVAVLF